MGEIKYIQKKRGRPAGQKNGPKVEKQRFSQNINIDKPKIYEIEFSDGSIWKYNWNKNPQSGLISTSYIYPEGFDFTLPEDDDNLPLTKRQWLNPITGKYVSYSRSVQLGLYTPEKGSGKRGRPKKNP